MRRVLSLFGVLFLLVLAPAASRAEVPEGGCSIVVTGYGATACRYLSNGPGTYRVATASGFRIQVCRNAGGCTGSEWIVLAAAAPSPGSSIAVRTDKLETRAGDLVDVGIQVTAINVVRWQDGVIDARDDQ